MKYRCEWMLQGMASSYSGLLEVEATDEDEARILAKRLVWARDFRDRNISSIKVHTVEAA